MASLGYSILKQLDTLRFETENRPAPTPLFVYSSPCPFLLLDLPVFTSIYTIALIVSFVLSASSNLPSKVVRVSSKCRVYSSKLVGNAPPSAGDSVLEARFSTASPGIASMLLYLYDGMISNASVLGL